LTIGTLDGRRLVVTIEEDGQDLDSAAGHILISLCSIFPNVPTEYAVCCYHMFVVSLQIVVICYWHWRAAMKEFVFLLSGGVS